MAIIATLKPTESTSPAGVLATASIPLNKLFVWEGNVRKTDADKGLEELKASILAHGVLQSLVVKKATRGKYAIVAGRRRYRVLSALAQEGNIAHDHPVPCRIVPGSADSTEISLAENVIRAPMHPADQFEAFRALIDDGQSVTDIAARFGIAEKAVKQRLKLARVSPMVFAAYRKDELTLEQVQAFAVTDDHVAQDRLLEELPHRNDDPEGIRDALTQDDISATDKRARFVTVAAYEEAGGEVRRDLFAEGDEGVFLLDPAVLDNLALAKLRAEAETVKAEGWKWVEAVIDFDHDAFADYRVRRPEPLPLSPESEAEQKRLADEYDTLFEAMPEEGDEETFARLKQIEARINEMQSTERAYSPDVLAIAGAIVTIGHDGDTKALRGIVKPEDEPEQSEEEQEKAPKAKQEFSAALVQSLTEARSAAISSSLAERPDIALAAVVHTLALGIFFAHSKESCLQLTPRVASFREESKGALELERLHEAWTGRLPNDEAALWQWCLGQDQDTLLQLLAFCSACTVNAVESKHDRECVLRIPHANALASALSLDMAKWFTPTAENYFSRVGRASIVTAITEAKGIPAKKSWDKQKKAAFAVFAEREIAGTGWLPPLLRAA
jgi:ParB family chromosome partitioning protein